jgi:dolichol-phosphate mannosyltransferase
LVDSSCTSEAQAKQQSARIGVVIPCYRAKPHVLGVLGRIGRSVDAIYVVDDCCPDGTGRHVEEHSRDPRVRVLFNERNEGVGGAVLAGVDAALQDGMDVVVKIDGDGQMDPALLPLFTAPIVAEQADLTKGNRFYNPDDVAAMPPMRIFGNAALSFFAKLSSGYWNVFDPTNGYIAADARLLAAMPRHKLHRRYFFETDLLFRSGLLQAKVIDIPMRAVYADEKSNLKIHAEIWRFLKGHARNFTKRIFYGYFLRDFNVASLELIFGLLLVLFGAVFAVASWGTEEPATAGTVMIAALPLLTGIILLVSFVNYDIQQIPREPVSPRLAARRAENDDSLRIPPPPIQSVAASVPDPERRLP